MLVSTNTDQNLTAYLHILLAMLVYTASAKTSISSTRSLATDTSTMCNVMVSGYAPLHIRRDREFVVE